MNGAKDGITAFLRNRSGNVLPIAAVGMLLSAALVGGGIDMSRAYRAQNRLQSACDAAALAGRRAVTTNGFDTTAQTQAENYFNTNFDNASLEASNTAKSFSSTDNGQTINGTASTELRLAVMKVFGFQKFNLSVTCTASMGVGNSDVVMVLDTTGSMDTETGSGTRMEALQTAMKNFYTTVKNATAGTNARIRYGFVPFSSTVNVGKLLYAKNPDYLVDTFHIQSRYPETKYATSTMTTEEVLNLSTTSPVKQTGDSWSKQSNCTKNLPDDVWVNVGNPEVTVTTETVGSVTTTKTTTKQAQSSTKIYSCAKDGGSNYYIWRAGGTRDYYTYKTTETDTSVLVFSYFTYKQRTEMETNPLPYAAYKTGNPVTLPMMGTNGADLTTTWAGCIEERGTVSEASFTYSTLNGITPSGSNDLDLDSAPTTDPVTKWAPMWPEIAYYRRTSGGSKTNDPTSLYGAKANSYCPYKAQLLTEMSQSQFNAYANSLYPSGSTYLDIGMAWGGRLSSPQGIFSDNVNLAPSNGGEVSRHVIFMTDGIMEPSNTIQSAWGIEYHDMRVTDNGSSNDASRHTSRFLALCEAIKAKGIRVWTISFTSGTNSSLSTCASANSYYNADNPTQLNAAFQEIAKQVGELRLTQ